MEKKIAFVSAKKNSSIVVSSHLTLFSEILKYGRKNINQLEDFLEFVKNSDDVMKITHNVWDMSKVRVKGNVYLTPLYLIWENDPKTAQLC